MRKNLVFLFVLMFSPAVIRTVGENGNLERDKMEKGMISESTPKTLEDECIRDSFAIGIEEMSDWHTANGTYYDPLDPKQTKPNADGIGSFGRSIQHGSIALGSCFAKFLKDKSNKIIIFIKIRNLDIMTPFGKGIFRLDDTMRDKLSTKDGYSKKSDAFFLDFNEADVNENLRNLEFKIIKIIETADM